jgi:hypothetical protein
LKHVEIAKFPRKKSGTSHWTPTTATPATRGWFKSEQFSGLQKKSTWCSFHCASASPQQIQYIAVLSDTVTHIGKPWDTLW